jgi:hypothetical protein
LLHVDPVPHWLSLLHTQRSWPETDSQVPPLAHAAPAVEHVVLGRGSQLKASSAASWLEVSGTELSHVECVPHWLLAVQAQ